MADEFAGCDPHESEMRRVSTEGRGTKVGENFWLTEFQCNDGTDILLLHPILPVLLQTIREHFGRPVTVNSGFRTNAHNQNIGGHPNSRHKHGLAADIEVQGIDPTDVANYAADHLKCGGVGWYNDFSHLDLYGYSRRWDKRTGGA